MPQFNPNRFAERRKQEEKDYIPVTYSFGLACVFGFVSLTLSFFMQVTAILFAIVLALISIPLSIIWLRRTARVHTVLCAMMSVAALIVAIVFAFLI